MAPVVQALRAARAPTRAVRHRPTPGDARPGARRFGLTPDVDLDLMPAQSLAGMTTAGPHGLEPVLPRSRPTSCWCTATRPPRSPRPSPPSTGRYRSATSRPGCGPATFLQPWPEEANRKPPGRWRRRTSRRPKARGQPAPRRGAPGSVHGYRQHGGRRAPSAVDRLVRDRGLHRGGSRGVFRSSTAAGGWCSITGHRRESFGDGLRRTLRPPSPSWRARTRTSTSSIPSISIPTSAARSSALSGRANVFLIGPVDYLPFVFLMRRSHLILTDSGGIQEEAPSLGKPVLVMREKTERPEAVARPERSGWSAPTVGLIRSEVGRLLKAPARPTTA